MHIPVHSKPSETKGHAELSPLMGLNWRSIRFRIHRDALVGVFVKSMGVLSVLFVQIFGWYRYSY
jgi:hypothetical protein